MAFIDKNLQLSGLAGAVQDLDPATAAAGLFSTDYLDRYDDEQASAMADGNNMYGRVTILEEDVLSGTANATVDFQLVSLPVLSGATATTLLNVTTVDEAAIITKTAHGIPVDARGTRVTAVNPVTGYAAATSYYLDDITVNQFTLYTKPKEAGGVVVSAQASAETMDLVIQPEVLGSSGPVPFQRLIKDYSTVAFRANPTGILQPIQRYVYMFCKPSADLTSGKALFHLTLEDGERRTHYRSGFTVE